MIFAEIYFSGCANSTISWKFNFAIQPNKKREPLKFLPAKISCIEENTLRISTNREVGKLRGRIEI